MEHNQNIDEGIIEKFLGAFPAEYMNLNKEKQLISAKIYNLLSEGDPVSIEEVANSLGMDIDNVKSITDEWAGIYYNEDGKIIGYWGLAVEKMGHRFKLGEKTLYTWCAWDTLFIPQIIGKTANVESRDPVTKETISLTVTPDSGISDIEPNDAVISFMIPNTEEVRSDVIKSFCHYVHFFESRKSAEEWISQSDKKDEMLILSLEEAYSIALRRNEMQLGDILEAA